MERSQLQRSGKPVIAQNRLLHPELQSLVVAKFDICLNPTFEYDAETSKQIVALFIHGHAKVSAAVLDRFPNLQVVSNHGVGIDHINVEDCTARGVLVCNTPDVLTGSTADMALALLLAIARRVVEGDAIARSPATTAFSPYWFGREVHGSCIGVIGMGRIGTAIAKRACHGFDMRVLYHNRRPVAPEAEQALNGAGYCADVMQLLAEADFVVVAAPATDGTRHLIGAKELAAMKRTAYLINIARGSLVDQDALTAALHDGTIAGAALDVTDPEPLPRDHPLLSAPNLIVTPHTGSATFQTRRAMAEMAIRNLEAALEFDRQVPCDRDGADVDRERDAISSSSSSAGVDATSAAANGSSCTASSSGTLHQRLHHCIPSCPNADAVFAHMHRRGRDRNN